MDTIPLERSRPVLPVEGMEYFGEEASTRYLALRHHIPVFTQDVGNGKSDVAEEDRVGVQIRVGNWSHLMCVDLYVITPSDGSKSTVYGYSDNWKPFTQADIVNCSYLRVTQLPASADDDPCALPGGMMLPSNAWLREQLDEMVDSRIPLVGPLAVVAASMGYLVDPTALLLGHGLLPIATEPETARDREVGGLPGDRLFEPDRRISRALLDTSSHALTSAPSA